MPRWRQVFDPKTQKSKFVPLDEAAAKSDGHAIHGEIESFVSPIDGTVISDRKQLREHCKKHGVVPSNEFTQEFYERKAKERENFYAANRSKAETLKVKQELYEKLTRAGY